jgi:DNA-binding NarL/FixJ family response regulator
MGAITILLADDHPVVRQGLTVLLNSEPGLEIVGEAADGREALDLAKKLEPDVILMDLSMPLLNGVDATRAIVRENPDARVLILTTYGHDKFVTQAVEAGAVGYVLKHSAAQDLIKAIKEVVAGRAYFTPAIARRLTAQQKEENSQSRKPRPRLPVAPTLTLRESQVLQLISDGMANKQIAAELGISIKTVEKHRQRVMNKLGIHETAGLTRYALGLEAGAN